MLDKILALRGLRGGSDKPVTESLEITENGTYTAPDGVDGYSPVTVNVPAPEILLQDKTITENGTYEADEGYDGLGSVTVEVAGSGGGTMEPLKTTGQITPTAQTEITITHNLGYVPDIFVLWVNYPNNGYVGYAIGYRKDFPIVPNYMQDICVVMSTGLQSNGNTSGIDTTGGKQLGAFYSADETTIGFGGLLFKLDTSKTYNWRAIRFLP